MDHPMDLSTYHDMKPIKTEFTEHHACFSEKHHFLDGPQGKTYTDLEPYNRSNTKHKQLLTSSAFGCSGVESWTRMHPDNWTPREVIEWMNSCVADINSERALEFNGGKFRELNGQRLVLMTQEEFEEKEPTMGKDLFQKFKHMRESANYTQPPSTDCIEYNHLDDVNLACQWGFSDSDDSLPGMAVFDKWDTIESSFYGQDTEIDKMLEQDLYTDQPLLAIDLAIDIETLQSMHDSEFDDSGYSDNSDGSCSPPHNSLPSFERAFTSVPVTVNGQLPQRPDTPLTTGHCHYTHSTAPVNEPAKKRGRGRPPKVRNANGEFPVKTTSTRGRKPGQISSKGNHLWEFIRDLLLNPKNNELIKWENYDEGIFRILKSEECARLWGVKKNNPTMSYEKMSRAMRFCRSAGYFDAVPKTGAYPKKLCFKFGQDSFGWRRSEIQGC